MIIVVQRVSRASVTVGDEVVGTIARGAMVLVGVVEGDTQKDADFLARKASTLRFFDDEEGKLNLSLAEVNGSVLAVSQFTLAADCSKGRRPSFVHAAPPVLAKDLYDRFCSTLREQGVPVETGRFRQTMAVELVNDGPVTFLISSR